MPGLYDDDDDYTDGPKALRDALKKAQDELKARDAKIADLEKTNTDLATKVKTTTLREALQASGVDPKYARFAERDEVEATPESVKQWVDDNKDVYAFLAPKAESPADPTDDEGDDGPGDEIDPELADAINAAQRVESSGRPSGSTNLIQQLEGIDINKVQTRAELEKLLGGLGVPLS